MKRDDFWMKDNSPYGRTYETNLLIITFEFHLLHHDTSEIDMRKQSKDMACETAT